MKSGRMQACIDFIRFNQVAEGFELGEEEETILREILDEERTADSAIELVVQQYSLPEEFEDVDHPGDVYADTKCLINFFNIKDRELLREIEMRFVNIRTAELLIHPKQTKFDLELLVDIHGHLFSDIFPSGGEIRQIAAAKRTEFCRPEFIPEMAADIFGKLRHQHYLKHMERTDFINDLSYYMGEVEALHPFRDGNGRAARLFFYELALNAGYEIEWYKVNPDRMLEADISAIDGDYQLLIDVLSEVVEHSEWKL